MNYMWEWLNNQSTSLTCKWKACPPLTQGLSGSAFAWWFLLWYLWWWRGSPSGGSSGSWSPQWCLGVVVWESCPPPFGTSKETGFSEVPCIFAQIWILQWMLTYSLKMFPKVCGHCVFVSKLIQVVLWGENFKIQIFLLNIECTSKTNPYR